MKHKIVLICLLFASINIFSQSNSISGLILDSSTMKGIGLATISIFKANDTSFFTYRLTNNQGQFKIVNLPKEIRLRILVTAVGYYTFRKEFTLSQENPFLNFNNIFLRHKENLLDEVLVIAERPPVVIRKDTIEFNAASFKTLPSELVEDLLKKLPGVEVNNEGSITFNGKTVSRILVEGKRFFGDNYKMATRNLPANIIDKVQVVDDKEDLEFSNDIITIHSNKVINLTLKKGVKKGWFGRVYIGAGTQQRYEAGGIVNLFKDTLQISLIGYDNNVNRSSFSIQDLNTAGGFKRSGTSSLFVNRGVAGEQFTINGISFGGGTTGINRSTGAGFNLNHAPTKNLAFYAQYFLGYGRNNLESVTNTTTPLNQGQFTSNTINTSIDKNHSHISNFSLNWKVDSLSRLIVNLGFVVKRNNVFRNVFQQNKAENDVVLSTNFGNISSLDSSNSINYFISYSHRFKRTKKTVSLTHSYNFTTDPFAQLTETENVIYSPQYIRYFFPQQRYNNSPTINKNYNIRFSNIISKVISYDVSSSLMFSTSTKDLITYTKSNASIIYDSVVQNASNNIERSIIRYYNGFGVTFSRKFLRISSNINWQQHWISDFYFIGLNSQQKQYYSFILPSLNLSLKNVTFNYTENINIPSISNLNPVPDNSNPFYIIRGNPNLQPTKQRYFNIYSNFGNEKTGVSRVLNFYNSFNSNEIVRRVVIDSSGIQMSIPENINKTTSLGYSFDSYGKIPKKNVLSINYSYGINGNIYFTDVLLNNDNISLATISQNISFGINLNWNDIFQFNPRYSIGFVLNKYTNNNSLLNDNSFTTQNFQGIFIFRPTKKLTITNSYKVLSQSQAVPGIPSNGLLVNAEVAYHIFKNSRGQIKLFMNDILNTNRGIYGSINGTNLSITRTNILNQYFLLSITYDIKDWLKQTKLSSNPSQKLLRF